MNIKQITITTVAVILTVFTLGVAAESGNKEHADKAAHEQKNHKPDKHQVVDSHKQSWDSDSHRDNDEWRSDSQDNENSNRQSDPDSTRGQERAEERRSENTSKHDQSNTESHWYDFIYGEDRVKADKEDHIDDLAEKKSRWWWPFN